MAKSVGSLDFGLSVASRERLALVGLLFLSLAAPRAAANGWESPRLIGDPGGLRTLLDERGIAVNGFLNQVTGVLVDGGDDVGHSATADLLALANLERLLGWRQATLFVHAKSAYDQNVNGAADALSDPFDDADFDEPIYVGQLWLEQAMWRGRVRMRIGYLDKQTTFDRNVYAESEDRLFLATALDNNLVVPLKVGLGATLILRPWQRFEIAAGTADADNRPPEAGYESAFDGAESMMAYVEATLGVEFGSGDRALPGKIRVGFVRDGTKRRRFGSEDPATGGGSGSRGHPVVYANVEQLLYRETAGSPEGLGWFARYGHADDDRNRVSDFWSTGFQYRGLIPGRSTDLLGVGVYQSLPSDRYRDEVDSSFDEETGLEVYYRAQLTPWLTFTPDLQWIDNPGGAKGRDSLWLLGFRFRVTL